MKWLALLAVIAFESSCTTLENRRDLYSPSPGYTETIFRPVPATVTTKTTTTTTTTHIEEEPPPQMAPPMPQFR